MTNLPGQPDIKKIGAYIKELRVKRKMTQRELGECLGVTDKAVSKWERGLSYPDVTLLLGLSQVLDVSIDELMEGEGFHTDEVSVDLQHMQKVVRKTMAYSKMSYSRKTKRYMIIVMAIALLFISIACLAVNYFVNRSFDWAPYMIGGLLLFILPAIPAVICKKHIFDWCALTFYLCLNGYQALIHQLTGGGKWLFPLAMPVILVVCACAYGIGKAFIYFRDNKFYAWAIALLLFSAGPIFGVDVIIYLNGIEKTDFSNYLAMLIFPILALSLYLIGRHLTKNERINDHDSDNTGTSN